MTAILQRGCPASCVSSIGIELQILEDVHFMFTRAVSMSSFSEKFLVFACFFQTIFLWRDLGIAGLAQLGKNLSALNALQPPVLLGTQRTLPTKATLMKAENITAQRSSNFLDMQFFHEQLQESGSNLLQHLLLKQKTDCFHYCPVEAENQLDCHCLSITTQRVKTHEYILKDEPNSEFPSWHWPVADDCNTGRWLKFAMRLISKRCYLSMSLPTPHGVLSENAKILVCLLVLPSQYFPESRFSLNWRIIWVSRLTSNEWIAFFLIAMRHLNEMDAALAESWTKGIDEELGQVRDTKRYFFHDLNDLYLRIFQCSPWVSLSCF